MNHKLKLPEPYFSAVESGHKTFEIRRNDRAFQKDDLLSLVDVSSCDCDSEKCYKRKPTIIKRITFVFSGDPNLRDNGGILPGYVILGLGDE
jgi:hypothetical protein